MESYGKHVLTIYLYRPSGRWSIGFSFKYTASLIPVLKNMGYRWDPKQRMWYKPYHRGFEGECETLQELPLRLVWDTRSYEIYHSEEFHNQFKQRWSRQLIKEQGEFPPEVTSFRNYLRQARYSERTIDTYVSLVGFFIQFTGKDVATLTHYDVETFNLKFILEGGRSITYHRQFTSALKLFIKHIVPAIAIDPEQLERPKKSFKLPKVLSEREVWQMIDLTANLKHQLILSMLYACGLRVGELCAMKMHQLDFDRRAVTILNGKGRVDRQLPLGDSLYHLLLHYIRLYQPSSYLIAGQDGLEYSPTSIRKIVSAALKRAKIQKKATPHTLRHSFATHLLENGTEMRYIQEFLGHKSVKTTMIYAHVRSEAVTKIVNPLDRIIMNRIQEGEDINKLFYPTKSVEKPPR